MLDLLVKHATITDGSSTGIGSLGVERGRVAARYAADADLPMARRAIDAGGLHLFPGIVDPHVHFYGEGIGDYSRLAARGGVTAFIGMVRGQPQDRLLDVAEAHIERGLTELIVDFGFHLVLYERAGVLDELPAVAQRGLLSFKLFMAYRQRGMMVSERFLIATMHAARQVGGIVLVHAEDGEIIDFREQQAAAAGLTGASDYARSRPAQAEAAAIGIATLGAETTGCPLYIVHLSSLAGLAAVDAARRRGVAVWVETCPQYLLLDESAVERLGAAAKVAPPLRKPEDCVGLGAALAAGAINTVGSDHASHSPEAKAAGNSNIFAAPFGMPGFPTLWPAMHTWAKRNNVPLSVLVRAMCETPARLFGMGERKGHLAPGADADFILVDPEATEIVDAKAFWPHVAPSPLAGERLSGWPQMTFVRGRAVWANGAIADQADHGIFVPQQAFR